MYIFSKTNLNYLGFTINEHTIKPNMEYISKITSLKRPENPKQIRKFIQMTKWLNKFTPKLSQYIEPINKLRHNIIKYGNTNL